MKTVDAIARKLVLACVSLVDALLLVYLAVPQG